MPLITACPECATQFVVTKKQLSAFEGKVRCGTCSLVFNAKEHLIKSTNSKKINADSPNSEDLVDDTESFEHSQVEDIALYAPTETDATQFNIDTSDTSNINIPAVVNDLALDRRYQDKPKKTPFSWALFFGGLILLLAAIMQTAYFLRTAITSNYPQTKPYFVQACQLLGCQIELAKDINLLTIDDSDMQEDVDYEKVIHFTSTLTNHANYAQSYPLIELTLTNTNDEPVLRRTFKPEQYLVGQDLSQGIAAKQEIRIKLALSTDEVAVAGYRLLLNY
jgi:predicted Zn finger-like uncharacterized protein